MSTVPLLVLAVGNPSRGDDALGPRLVERLRETGIGADDGVELMTDFQLQIEHALDVDGRRAVLFVDAARPGTVDEVGIAPIEADLRPPAASHALRPQAVLHVARRLRGDVPPAWLLAIEGESFGLGDDLSPPAAARLERATDLARGWLRERRRPCTS